MEYKTNYSVGTKIDAVINFITSEEAESENRGIEGDAGKVYTFYTPDLEYTVGLGEGKWTKKIEKGITTALNGARKFESDNILVEVPKGYESEVMLAAMTGMYKFEQYKTEKTFMPANIYFDFIDEDYYSDEVAVVEVMAEAIEYTKDLQNMNADEMTPHLLGQASHDLARGNDRIHTNVINASGKFPAIEAVGAASDVASVLIEMSYEGNPDDSYTTVLIGKGVTYDSGGLSLKPSDSMADMKFDMSGAAVVIGVMHQMINDNPNLNLVVLVPAAENAIGPEAYKVGDVINTYSGQTVEVKNTDAEGRLILADALSYAQENYNIECMIDIATLTGAVVSALGKNIAGVFSNDKGKSYLALLKESAEVVNENIWELPLNDDIKDAMSSKIADMSNMSTLKGQHGSSSAAGFLSKFVDGSTPWIHIDAAGVLHNDDGGTAWGVRLLSDFVYSLQ